MFTPAVIKKEQPIVKVIKATKPILGNDTSLRKLRVCAYGILSI